MLESPKVHSVWQQTALQTCITEDFMRYFVSSIVAYRHPAHIVVRLAEVSDCSHAVKRVVIQGTSFSFSSFLFSFSSFFHFFKQKH